MAYEITLADDGIEVVEGADAYQQEGPLTTFFRTSPGRAVVDCWSTRLASFRTADIRIIRRCRACRPGLATGRADRAGCRYQVVGSGRPSS